MATINTPDSGRLPESPHDTPQSLTGLLTGFSQSVWRLFSKPQTVTPPAARPRQARRVKEYAPHGVECAPEAALDINAIREEIARTGKAPEDKTFVLHGKNNVTGEEATLQCSVSYTGQPNEDFLNVSIEGEQGTELDISFREHNKATIDSVVKIEKEGYGFYSMLMRNLLRNVPSVESQIANSETDYLIDEVKRKGMSDLKEIPYSVLAAESPIARFGNTMMATLHEDSKGRRIITGYAVDEALSILLEKAVQLQRWKRGKEILASHKIAEGDLALDFDAFFKAHPKLPYSELVLLRKVVGQPVPSSADAHTLAQELRSHRNRRLDADHHDLLIDLLDRQIAYLETPLTPEQ